MSHISKSEDNDKLENLFRNTNITRALQKRREQIKDAREYKAKLHQGFSHSLEELKLALEKTSLSKTKSETDCQKSYSVKTTKLPKKVSFHEPNLQETLSSSVKDRLKQFFSKFSPPQVFNQAVSVNEHQVEHVETALPIKKPNKQLQFEHPKHDILEPQPDLDLLNLDNSFIDNLNNPVTNEDAQLILFEYQPNVQQLQNNVDIFEDYYYSDMASCVPTSFRGFSSDDVEAWFRHLDLWLQTQRTPTERSKICHAALFLKDSALHYFNTLNIIDMVPEGQQQPEGTIMTYNQFKDGMVNQYRREPGDNWREISALFQIKQGPTEKTESYINGVQTRGMAARATEDQIRIAAIAGLRDDVKAVIMHHDINTLGDICKWAIMSEKLQVNPASDVIQAVKKLEDVVERMQVRAVTEVEHDNEGVWNATGGRGGGGFQRARGWSNGRGRGQQGRGAQASRQGALTYNNMFSRSNILSRPTYNASQETSYCYKCGRAPHAASECPARNAVCRFCLKPGHWQSVCLQKNRGRGEINSQY